MSTTLKTPTVSTDKLDYAPGSTVYITSSEFTSGSTIQYTITWEDVFGNDYINTWQVTDGAAGDGDPVGGTIDTTWIVPVSALDSTLTLTALEDTDGDGLFEEGELSATTMFTDRAQANLDQWGNGQAPDAATAADEWQNGNLNEAKSHYAEGDFIPYRTVMADMTTGAFYTLKISWDTTKDDGPTTDHVIDYIGTYDASFPAGRNETPPDPLIGVTGATEVEAVEIPTDPNVAGLASVGGVSSTGDFTFYGGIDFIGFVHWGLDGAFGGQSTDDLLYKVGANGILGGGDDSLWDAGTDNVFGTGDDD